MSKTASGLIAYCKAQLGKPYWWGTFGNTASASLYKAKKAQYPNYYTASDFPSQYGKRVHDCVGMIKGYRWSATPTSTPVYNASQDVAVSGLYDQCSKRGLLKTMPKVPGTCVFMPGHVGVYIGDGYVIEARGHAYGVVKTKLTERPWTRWGQPSWITYDTSDEDKADPVKTERKGIDVSYANGTVNWSKVAADGIQFAIIRAGCGDYRREGQMHEDSQFRRNVAGAAALGLHIGFYWFCYAQTVSEVKREADFFCDILDGCGVKPDYPVCFDYEYDSEKKAPPKDNIVDIARAFLARVKERGYYPANYTNIDYLSRGFSKLTGEYDTWLAQWSVSKPSRDCGIWQYSSGGRVNGISGNVDMNISYKDYPAIIDGGDTPTPKEGTCMVECKVIKNGSKGSAVKRWQTLLNSLEYNCGTVDGIFGAKTDSATKKFQKDYGLAVDGVVGAQTWGALIGG